MTKFLKLLFKYFPTSFQVFFLSYYYAKFLNKVSSIVESKEPDLIVVKSLVDSGDQVIDVGANIGLYAKYLSDLVGVNGIVYSFEPHPYTFSILQTTIKNRLGLVNVVLKNIALSQENKELVIETPINKLGISNYYRTQVKDQQEINNYRNAITIKAESLDNFVSNLDSSISLIKIDVEGHELSVIRGSIVTLNKFNPALLVEISGNPNIKDSDSFNLFNILLDMNYRAYFLKDGFLYKWQPDTESINYFFLTDTHLNKISHLIKN